MRNIKKTKRKKSQLHRSRERNKANRDLKKALKEFNSLDHSGESFRQIIGEVGEIVGQVSKKKIERVEKESSLPKKRQRVDREK